MENSKRPRVEEEEEKSQCDLEGFQLNRILMNDAKSKRVHVLGRFKDSEEDAIITMVKTAFSEDSVTKILSEDTALEEEFSNDIYGQYGALTKPSHNSINTQIIRPATEKHVLKYTQQKPYLLQETSHSYKTVTKPHLDRQSFSIQWVYNILEHKTESERIVFEDPDPDTGFILLPDIKWDGKQIEDLYLVAIVHRRDVKSIRDLNTTHLLLLKNILRKGMETINSKYGVPETQVRAYFHYYPSYYHLHVHFNHLQYDVGGISVGKAHLLTDVIENIEVVDGDFYEKKTLAVTLLERNPLLAILQNTK